MASPNPQRAVPLSSPSHSQATTPPDVRQNTHLNPQAGITLRAVALGTILIPFNAFLIVRQEWVLFGPYPSTISLFANVIFLLFIGIGLNALVRRIAPRIAFSQGELLTIYVMLSISTGLAGLDGAGILAQIIPHGAWFGTTNHLTSFLAAFPDWLVVRDHDVLRGHYLGNSSLYRATTLRAWAIPVLAWTGFLTLLLFVANCLNVLVRRQWADKERLTFPMTWLPLEMTEPTNLSPLGNHLPFFRNRLMWAGFATAATLSLWNGLAYLYPSLPSLPIGTVDLKPLLTTKPFNAIDWLPLTFYPLAIGLGYLLPLDLLFSCWFFFLFWKMQIVASSALAWDTTPDFPFIKEQGFGSLLGLFGYYFYTGRKTYAAVWRSGVTALKPSGRTGETARNGEALSDREALLGLGLGSAGLLAFCLSIGVAWWVAVLFFAIYLATISVVTRIRAELGPPVHDFHFMGPDAMLPRVVSANSLRQADMAFFTFSFAITRAHRGDTMPVGLEGLQMAHRRGIEARRLFGAIILATAMSVLSAFWAFEHHAYALGTTAKFNQGFGHATQAFSRMGNWTNGSLDAHPNVPATTAMGIGLLTTLGLFAMRARFFGFPFHPIGYAIASSWSIHLVWMPLFVAWVLKGLTIRYGGLKYYRQFLPFFLGLALGDCVMGTVWAFVSLLLNAPTYNFFGA